MQGGDVRQGLGEALLRALHAALAEHHVGIPLVEPVVLLQPEHEVAVGADLRGEVFAIVESLRIQRQRRDLRAQGRSWPERARSRGRGHPLRRLHGDDREGPVGAGRRHLGPSQSGEQARHRADILATESGAAIDSVDVILSDTQSSPPMAAPRLMAMADGAMEKSMPTQVMAGPLDVQATVTIRYRLR